MKKFNKNAILFVFAIMFLLLGFCKGKFQPLVESVYTVYSDLINGIHIKDIDFSNVESSLTKSLKYHDELMDINSVKDNLLGVRVIQKEETTIVKTDSDYLSEPVEYINDEKLDETISRIDGLYNKAKNCNANFLYIAAPNKTYDTQFPSNVRDYSKLNFDRFVNKLNDKSIPNLNMVSILQNQNKDFLENYFVTDHHWKPESGFLASRAICNELNTRYNFEYNKDYCDMKNYNVKIYEDYFLGSQGKKVGSYFTNKGYDDISFITPKFNTDLTEIQPYKDEVRDGDFTNTVLFMDNVKEKDYYNLNPYALYSGGDFRLQIMKNNLNMDGKKILIIRDSFACAVTPFLSLNTNELHIVDIRDYDYYIGERLNIYDYIEKTKPDYVLVLYTNALDVNDSEGRYDFNYHK